MSEYGSFSIHDLSKDTSLSCPSGIQHLLLCHIQYTQSLLASIQIYSLWAIHD